MRRLRVLQVVHRYRPALGGVEQHVAEVAEGLVRRGHSVDVVTTRSSNIWTYHTDYSSFETIDGVDVYRYRCLPRGWLTNRVLKLGSDNLKRSQRWWWEALVVAGKGPFSPGIVWHILMRGREYDVIHIQALPFFHPVYAYCCARLAGRPVVITPHISVDHPQDFDLMLYRRILRGADLVTTQTECETPYLVERGVQSSRIMRDGCGINVNDFPMRDQSECRRRLGLAADAFVLLFLARKEPYKGLRPLVQAFSGLRSKWPSLVLVSAGRGTEDSKRLRNEYYDLPNWLDLDVVDEDQRLDLLNGCDALVLPSTGEACGLVFLESWAVKKPVIGARAGAVPWVIEDCRDGLLVNPADPVDLARAIEQLLACPDFARDLGLAGHAKVLGQFTIDKVSARNEEGYYRVSGEPNYARRVQ